MNGNENSIGQNHIRKICEGVDCNKQYSAQIKVQVGKLGTIPLNLCTDCLKRFKAKKNESRKGRIRK